MRESGRVLEILLPPPHKHPVNTPHGVKACLLVYDVVQGARYPGPQVKLSARIGGTGRACIAGLRLPHPHRDTMLQLGKGTVISNRVQDWRRIPPWVCQTVPLSLLSQVCLQTLPAHRMCALRNPSIVVSRRSVTINFKILHKRLVEEPVATVTEEKLPEFGFEACLQSVSKFTK